MFLEEFSSFLEGLVSTTSALLVAGDFNFHIDEPNDCDARRFLQVLESFDLIQHVSEATHKKGHILDLIITRAHEKLVGRCTVDNPFVSDHLAVHSLLDLAKLPLERKRDKTDKTWVRFGNILKQSLSLLMLTLLMLKLGGYLP